MNPVLSFIVKHRNDLLLILSLALIALALAGVFAVVSTPGTRVDIIVDGKPFGSFALDQDAVIDINGTNTLVISGGVAYMNDADCKNGTCVRRGAISSSGETIICLPNKIIVTVVGDQGDPFSGNGGNGDNGGNGGNGGVDAVSG